MASDHSDDDDEGMTHKEEPMSPKSPDSVSFPKKASETYFSKIKCY